MSCNWHFSYQERGLIHLEFSIRLREYEVDVDSSKRRGPEVERIYFVIIEMARKSCLSSVQRSMRFIVHISSIWANIEHVEILFL